MSNIDLYIRDKHSGKIHRIGDDHHDHLVITKEGELWYSHLQCGDGCILGKNDIDFGFEFVPNANDYGYNYDPREGENENTDS